MSTEQNKAIVRRFLEEYTPAVVDELLVPNYIHHDPSLPPELQRGRDAYKQINNMFHAAFPDLQVTVEDLVAEGNKVAARWNWGGTHQGEMMGIPATRKHVAATGTSIHRVAEGKIVESWFNFDALGMMRQLGVVPAPAQPS
jgi:steroid delta-isomerase-like uncharacterized protein